MSSGIAGVMGVMNPNLEDISQSQNALEDTHKVGRLGTEWVSPLASGDTSRWLSFLNCLTQGGGGETHSEQLMNSRGLLTILGIPGTTEWREALKRTA